MLFYRFLVRSNLLFSDLPRVLFVKQSVGCGAVAGGDCVVVTIRNNEEAAFVLREARRGIAQ